jgi:diguanylate cyclase (GGDEF)-like protein/PAS domain S-box-containing protein
MNTRACRAAPAVHEKPARAATVTLRLITDTLEAPAPALARARADLGLEAFEQLFTNAGCMLAVFDGQGRFVVANPACSRVLGCQPEELIGQSLLDCLHPHDPAAAARKADVAAGWQPGFMELLARHRHSDGGWRSLLWSGSAHGDYWYASAKDVTEWLRLEHRVGRDPLTSLPNREVFTDELTRALGRHGRASLDLGVLFIDIDSFKQVNDSIGHEGGDRLLAEAAVRLRDAVRVGDVVGRLGGDEFAIMLELLENDFEAVAVARRVIAAFSEPFDVGGSSVRVSASVGLAVAKDSEKTADRLIHEADIAMYRAKAIGRNRFAIFDTELRIEVDRRLSVERDLRNALARDEFEILYQPVVSLADASVASCEALVRWTHGQWGPISPDEFIPLAEENGLIVPIGAWVLGTALRQLAQWRAQGSEIGISVNISPRQLTDESAGLMVAALLAETGVPPSALCLEVTETAILSDPLRTAARLAEMRALGVRIAFDDFGTGYSSLRHLSQLPVDVIKLDRTFVSALHTPDGRRDRAVLIAVTTAARELGISVIAEGVEDTEQLAELRRAGCDYAQGFLFSEPRPAGSTPPDAAGGVVVRRAQEHARTEAESANGPSAAADSHVHPVSQSS